MQPEETENRLALQNPREAPEWAAQTSQMAKREAENKAEGALLGSPFKDQLDPRPSPPHCPARHPLLSEPEQGTASQTALDPRPLAPGYRAGGRDTPACLAGLR